MFKLILQIVGVIVLALLGLMLLGFVFRMVSILISMVVGLLILAGIVYLVSLLFKLGKDEEVKAYSFKILDRTKTAVPLFAAEPTVKDLVHTQQISKLTEWALNGTIVEIDNDTQVIVLEDNREKEAVRVRVSNGQFKGRDGWVCRSVLHKTEDQNLLNG